MTKGSNIWKICGLDGTEKAEIRELEYHGEWMEDEYVIVTVKSAVPIDWQRGDSLEYRGERFSVYYDPNVIKKARSGSYGEGFTYENVKLYSEAARMKDINFNDIVLYDNKIPYTSLNSFSFFAETVEDLADRIQANLDRVEPGGWRVYTPDYARTRVRHGGDGNAAIGSIMYAWGSYYEQKDAYTPVGKTDVNVTADGLKCWDALKLSYTAFEVGFFVTGRTVVIGGNPIIAGADGDGSEGHDFRYGKGMGLHEIERTTNEDSKVVTKLFAYGSDKNVPLGYYANLGKRIKFRIKHKTEREYIRNMPDLLIWIETPYVSVRSAFNDTEMFWVELSCNGKTAMLQAKKWTYSYATEKDDDTLDHEIEYLVFQTDSYKPEGVAFYNAVAAGMDVYVTAGMNINKVPEAFIEPPQDYNYTAALSINKLMLPGFPRKSLFRWIVDSGEATRIDYSKRKATWRGYTAIFSDDKEDPYIISPNFEKEGLCEGSVTFDESSGKEICPTIEGTGLDKVLWAEQMDDNGYLGDNPKAGETTFGLMSNSLYNQDGSLKYEIDWTDNSGNDVVITMKSGACVGREFKMKKAKRNDAGLWELTLERYYDSSIGRYFPYREQGSNTLYQVVGSGNSHGVGESDLFVATGINLPDSFVEIAAVKLLEEALSHLASVDHQRYTYIPKVDEIYMQQQDDFTMGDHEDDDERIGEYGTVSLHETLHAGMQMEINDDDLDVHYRPFIDVLTIKENGNNGIPTYDVVLRDEKEMTLQERIESRIDGGRSGVLNVTGGGGVSESDIEAIGDSLFLSKTHEDETEYLISLFGGAIVDKMLRSPDFLRGLWTEDTDAITGETILSNDGSGFAVTKDADGKWSIEIDEAIVRSLIRTKDLMANEADIDKMTRQTLFKLGLKTLGDIILGDYEEGKSGGILTPEGNAELRSLVARLQATIGSGLYPDEDNPELRKPSLTVNGDSEFSHNLSSQEFISGFLSGKGWAIQRKTYVNSAGVEETKWSMEIDNLTVRNILRVYELVVSQLRGENDNYIFAAMAEVDHYDPVSGRVWLSTHGGKIYNPFRVGDYIMVQRYQPGNDVVSGGDGYITKQYELIILAVGSGGENDPKDENGDRLDWVLFKNFTSQMDGNISPETLITKGDTFCRVDNETDPERKGLMSITSVGPNTPYMDVVYGMKTDPDHSLKSRLGNLEGVKTDLFGWLEGFGAYINNLYGVGKFFNAQTGEAMESRIEATNERMRSVYKETTFDITDADNKINNGFFQDDLDGWTTVKVNDSNGTVTADGDGPEMNYSDSTHKWSMSHVDQNNQIAVASGETTTVDGQSYQLPLLMNGLQLEVQKTLKSEVSEVGGMKVLHLTKSGVIQDFSLMDENLSHKKLSADDNEFEATTGQMEDNGEYEKTTYAYWEKYYRNWLFENWERLYPGVTYEECKVDEIITSDTAVTWINNQVATWTATYGNNYDRLTSTEAEPDKLFLGIRIMPLTEGWLKIGFLTESGRFDQYQNATQCFSKHFSGAGSTMKWEVATWNDDPTDGTCWYFPCDSDSSRKRGRLLIAYTGECYIRFVVLSNDPIEESEHEYETLIEQNARRIRMQAKKDEKEFSELVIQHNAIVQRITDNRNVADRALKDILGIEYDEKTGMYTFPEDWFDSNYTYGSWLIHTKSRIDFLFTKFDEYGNLIGYSNHTQTADYISDIIASGSSYPTWAVNCLDFAKAFLRFSNTYYENSNLKYGVWLTAIADNALSASEITTIKALFKSTGDIQKKYASAASKIGDIPSDIADLGNDKKISDPEGKMLIVNFFNRVIATRYDAVKAAVNGLSADDGNTNINMNNSAFLNLKNMEIPQMEEACRELVAMIVNRYGEQKLGENIQAVQEGFKAYQDSLDDAVKDAYAGQNVDFVNWLSNTAWSSVQAIAIIDKSTGKIKTESIKTQTAELIQNAINNYSDGTFSDYQQTSEGFESFVACIAKDRNDFANFETAQGEVKDYLEDNILNRSEYEAMKKLRMSLVTEYTDITAAYTQIHGNANLPGNDNDAATVKGKIKKAYDELSVAYNTLISSIDTLLADYYEALQTNTSGNIDVKVSDATKDAVNTNFTAFNEKLTAYQKALDNASNEINKAVANSLVTQLKNLIHPDVLKNNDKFAYAGYTENDALHLSQVYGQWDLNEDGSLKQLRDYSTSTQTATAISEAVTGLAKTSDVETLISKINGDIQSINESLETLGADQGSLDESYASFVIQTNKSISNIVGKWNTDSEGNITTLRDYSTSTQTANLIQSSVAALKKTVIDLADISKWERKTTQEAEGGTYDDKTTDNPKGIKISSTSRILYCDLIPVTKFASVKIEEGFDVFFVYFNSAGTVCSKTGSGWKTVTKKDGVVTSNMVTINPLEGSLPNTLAYVGLLVKKTNSSDIYATDIPSTGIILVDSRVADVSYVNQKANEISTSVIQTAEGNADAKVQALRDKIENDVIKDDNGNSNYASLMLQTANAIATIVAEFNTDGSIKTYSTWKQGVDSIKSTVTSLERTIIDLADSNKWAQGSTTGTKAGVSYNDIAYSNVASCIRYMDLIPITSDTRFSVKTGFQFVCIYFTADKKVCSTITSGFQPSTDGGDVSMSVPSDAAYALLVVRRFGQVGSISPSQVGLSGIAMIDSKIASISYVDQKAESITSTVTNNKAAAEAAFNKLYGTSNLTFDNAGDNWSSASWLFQNKNGITGAAAQFDAKGNIISTSKLQLALNGIQTSVEDYLTSTYSILNQTAEGIVAMVDKDYIESLDLDYLTDADINHYYTKEELKIGGNAITTVVSGLQTKVNNITAEWEQGTVAEAGSTGLAYDVIKKDNTNAIRTVSLIPFDASKSPMFYINKGFTLRIAFFNSGGGYVGSKSNGTPNDKNLVKFTGSYPSSATQCAISIIYSSAFTKEQLQSAGFHMTNSEVATTAEITASVGWEDDGNGGKQLKSSIKLQADHIQQVADNISISANNINWKVTGGWKINNGTYDTLSFDANGNLTIAGTINSNATISSGVNINTGAKVDGMKLGTPMLDYKAQYVPIPSGSGDVTKDLSWDGGSTIILYGSHSSGNLYMRLPSQSTIRSTLGISSGNFVVELNIINLSNYEHLYVAFSSTNGVNTTYPRRMSFDNTAWTGGEANIQLANGDYMKILLVFNNSYYNGYTIIHQL